MRKGAIFLTIFFVLCALLTVSSGTTIADTEEMHMHRHAGEGVNMKAARGGEIVVNLETRPERIRAGIPTEIVFSLRDNRGRPVQDLTVMHERLLHVVIVSGNFAVFAHIHPEDFGPITPEMRNKAEYHVYYTFPMAGRYLVALDGAGKNGLFSEHFTVDVSGEPKMGPLEEDFSREKRFDDYMVTFSSAPEQVVAGKEITLKYLVRKDGKPVTDLEPYLAAPMHLAIIKADLTNFIHAHGELPDGQTGGQPMGHIHGLMKKRFGPEIEARVIFPVRGVYQIFGQIKREDKVLSLSFMVEVK